MQWHHNSLSYRIISGTRSYYGNARSALEYAAALVSALTQHLHFMHTNEEGRKTDLLLNIMHLEFEKVRRQASEMTPVIERRPRKSR